MSDGAPIYDPYAAQGPTPPNPGAAPHGPAKTSALAIWALVLGVLGFTCIPAIGGLFALTLGIVAKGEINRSEGSLTGSGLALGGAVLGALNVVASVLGLAALLSWAGSPSSPTAAPAPPAPIVAPAPAPTTLLPTPPSPAPKSPGPTSSRQGGVVATKIGKVDLVDLDRDLTSLSRELEGQRKTAARDGKKVLLWVVVDDCLPCNGVAASLPASEMQTALEQVRVVRVNARDFGQDLTLLGIPVAKVPGFALLGDGSRPLDYVNGGEWDEDIARNIAPVLGNFVRGRYAKRREPWRGPRREDETAL